MANLYGVANAPGYWVQGGNIGGADISPVLSTETNLYDSGPLIAPSQGWFYPIGVAFFTVAVGTPVFTGLNFSMRVNGGADFMSIGINPTGLTAGGSYFWTMQFFGTPSQTVYQGAGGHVQITVIVAGTTVIIRSGQSNYQVGLYRAPDQ